VTALLLALPACKVERPPWLETERGEVRRVSEVVADGRGDVEQRDPPPFELAPRDGGMEHSEDYPCSDCHEYDPEDPPNLEPRKLEDAHESIELVHGKGRLWCMDCHLASDRDKLRGRQGAPVATREVYRMCGRCHGAIERDFVFGVHGRRLERWEGQRVLLSCLSCHGPHDPAIPPRRPASPPRHRSDLPAAVDYEPPSGLVERLLEGNQP
jgi:hypothetical protein